MKKTDTRKKDTKTDKPLKGYFSKRTSLFAVYKGKKYKAFVFTTGTMKYAGQLYNSPSVAGIAVTKKKTINGWKFWKYKDKNGELVYIDQLRK